MTVRAAGEKRLRHSQNSVILMPDSGCTQEHFSEGFKLGRCRRGFDDVEGVLQGVLTVTTHES